MAWCPKCKMEYRDEITTCADCGVTLVAENMEQKDNLVELCQIEKEEVANKLVEFLEYSNIESIMEYIEEKQSYEVKVDSEILKNARKLLSAFTKTEEEKAMAEKKEEDKEKEDTNLKTSHSYVKKKDQYEDLKSSAATFIIFGFAGIIFTILNVIGVIKFIDNIVMYGALTLLFIVFLIIGFSTQIKAKKVKGEIGNEEDTTDKLNDWMKEKFTKELLDSMRDPDVSDEINFMAQLDKMKEMITEEFGEMDEAYLDQVAEEFYNNHF